MVTQSASGVTDAVALPSPTDTSLTAYLRHLTVHAAGGTLAEQSGLMLFAGAHNYPGAFTNGVIRTGPGAPPGELLDAAATFFAPRRSGYAIWVRGDADADLAHACRDAGLYERPPAEGNPGLLCRTPLPAPVVPPGSELRVVDDEGGAAEYLAVVAAAYGLGDAPAPVQQAVLFSTASVLAPEVTAVLAYADGVPVSGCSVFLHAGVGGLNWAATAPAARGGGLSRATFLACAAAAVEAGARTLVAAPSSQAGARVWCGLGFTPVTVYRRFLAAPARRRR